MMDPELMALLTQARATGANKNLSSVLRNLNNPMLAFLAGVPQQPTDVSADMPLMSQYANVSDPVIQEIVSKINAGTNEYELSSWFANRMADPQFALAVADTGMQEDDLLALAKGMQRERSKAGSSVRDSWWAKAGLSDPSQLYTEATVPLSEREALRIADIRIGSRPAREMLSRAKMEESNARRGVELSDKTLADFLGNLRSIEMQGGGSVPAMSLARMRRDIESRRGGITEEGLQGLVEKYRPENADYAKAYEKDIQQLYKRGRPSAPGKSRDALTKAQENVGLAQQQLNAAAEEEAAIRRGRARAFAEAGRTPARDELQNMLRFMTGK